MTGDREALPDRIRRIAARARRAPDVRLRAMLNALCKAYPGAVAGVFIPAGKGSRLARFYSATDSLHFYQAAHLPALLADIPTSDGGQRFLPLAQHPAPLAWLSIREGAEQIPADLEQQLCALFDGIVAELLTDETSDGSASIPSQLISQEAVIWHDGFHLRESRTLYRFSRGVQQTPRLNELIHFILSAITSPDGGDFGAAALFLLNERTAVLQGMLGVTRDSATHVFPPESGENAWHRPQITAQAQRLQRETAWGKSVTRLRLRLEDDQPTAHALFDQTLLHIRFPQAEDAIFTLLRETLGCGSYACIPLHGHDRPFGALVVATETVEELSAERLDFLDIFARQSATAIENALLLRRLEVANEELRETQERAQQDEKLAMLGEAVATIAHDIKNPLITIGGFARRIQKLAPDDASRQYAETIAREARRLEELLGGILSFSRRQLICYSTCDPNTLAREALQTEAIPLQRAGITVDVETVADIPQISGDPVRLSQVLINLLANARHAMPQGGKIALRIRRSLLRGTPAVAFEIEDQGNGIPDEIRGSIFKPFFTTKVTGTGLGLAICVRIVEQHHGEIKGYNSPHGGAIFRFLIPTAQPAPLAPA